ncbi:unnamed protein product, partial [Didymodactylos carnosus]
MASCARTRVRGRHGSPTSDTQFGIIGCDTSGLVTLKELLAEGHDGYMVSSNVVTMFSDFFGLEQDKNDLLEKPRMWSFIEYSKYLNDYAEHFELKPYIKFQTCVQSVWKNVPTNKWNIKAKSVVDEKETVYTFDRIYNMYEIICSGTHQKRSMPSFNGQHLYKGTIKHLQDVTKFEDFTDKRLCIVESGEGGSDITLAVAKYGAKVYLSIRKDHGFILPRYPHGPFYPADLGTTRAIHSIPRAQICDWCNSNLTALNPTKCAWMSGSNSSNTADTFQFKLRDGSLIQRSQ